MPAPPIMQAIQIPQFGGPEVLTIKEVPTPSIGDEEILIQTAATALNRADLLQRMGKYPPPAGASPIPGLEAAGVVVDKGQKVSQWKIGDRVCALLPGGGYAQYISIPQGMALPIPEGLSFEQAAAVPEVFLTAHQAIHWLADLKTGERILIHAGASGVGTAAIQMAKQIGAEIIVTASAGKHPLCKKLGAQLCIDYKSEDFAEAIAKYTTNKGVDVIIDFIGAPYFQNNIDSLAVEGRLVQLAFMGGVLAEEINLGPLLRKRLKLMGSTLRARSLDYKVDLTRDFAQKYWHLFTNGAFEAIVDSVYPWTEVVKAHQRMEANLNQGKIVLKL